MQRVMKINASAKSLVERLCDIKTYAILVLNFFGSVCAPDKATLKDENHDLQCTTAGPYKAIPPIFLRLALSVDLALIWWAFIPSARGPLPGCSAHLLSADVLNKSTRHAGTIALLFALSPAWEHEFLFPSMTLHTANTFDVVCQLDRNDTLDETPQNKKQKVATGLLLDKLHKQDFTGPLSCRASKALGPISRYRVADILHHMKIVSRASRPGLLVGFPRILCDGLYCTEISRCRERSHMPCWMP